MMDKYLAFSRLGNKGRLANSIFEVCSTIGLARKHNRIPVFNKWPYIKYFKGELNPIPEGVKFETVKEKYFHHHEWHFDDDKNYDLDAYLQSEKYFLNCKDEIKELLTFKPDFLQSVKNKLPANFFEKKTILIQIRRGDYVSNEFYWQVPIAYYIDSLITYFPDWQERNILFLSDEMAYARVHFECLSPNVFFTDNFNDIEQLCAGSLCDDFIIANSSFGFWATWLGEKEHSKIIHCGHLHSGKLQEKSEPRDYYPERWTRHQKDSYKIDLTDTTFTIPILMDSPDRKANLDLAVCMLQKNFDTNIIIGEQGGTKFEYMSKYCRYMKFDLKYFHRTKMLNDMAMASDTPYLANWDADVIIPPMQIYLTVERLRNGADMEFPYDGRFARLPRVPWFKEIEKLLDIGAIGDTEPKGKRGRPVPESSVGGAVFFNKESFIDGGMENENMISFGPEDGERNERFTKLGFKISPQDERVQGCLYHIDHWCGPDSSRTNPFFKQNHAEIDKIRAMKQEELRLYVDTWFWRHKYTESYFKRISPGSVKSAECVMSELRDMGIKYKSVIDIGAGVGEWADNNPDYIGVDYKIPQRSLLIKPEQYIECNLETDIVKGKYDLCICVEVFEHISEGRADTLIEMLCNLSEKILFSAAIKGQGGTGHCNEQPANYWAEKFKANKFYPYKTDIRKALFNNENVQVWYKQNLILFTPIKYKIDYELDFVHPEMFASCIQHFKNQLMQLQEV